MSENKDETVAPSPWRLDLRGSRILVVDDTPANIDVLFEVLNAAGYEVAVATSGETVPSKLHGTANRISSCSTL